MYWDTAHSEWILTRRDGMKFGFGVYAPLQWIEDRNGNRVTLVREGGIDGPITQIRTPHGHWIDLSLRQLQPHHPSSRQCRSSRQIRIQQRWLPHQGNRPARARHPL